MDIAVERSRLLDESTLPPALRDALRQASPSVFLQTLAELALQPAYTVAVFTTAPSLAFELCARWRQQPLVALVSAFGRLIDAFPHLCDAAAQALARNGRDTDLLECLSALADPEQNTDKDKELMLGLLRLLRFNNSLFAPLIKPASLQLLLSHSDRFLRFLAARILCAYLHASDATLESILSSRVGDEPVNDLFEGLQIDYNFYELWEHKRIEDTQAILARSVSAIRDAHQSHQETYVVEDADLDSGCTIVARTLLPRAFDTSGGNRSASALCFVDTPTAQSNLRNIAQALTLPHRPIIVSGEAGSGKTFMINYVASRLRKADSMVTLHLNEQTDAKLLVGVYTTGSEPGTFQWQPGVLTKAVTDGRWVMIEDLDRAPREVMSTLLPLLERRELPLSSLGKTIKAAPGFRLLATVRTASKSFATQSIRSFKHVGARFWHEVPLCSQSSNELGDILRGTYPALRTFVDTMMRVYRGLVESETFNSRLNASQDRQLSSRELLRWASRLNRTLGRVDSYLNDGIVSEEIFDAVFLDAVDCFAANVSDSTSRGALIATISRGLQIDSSRALHLLTNRTIEIRATSQSTSKMVEIGRTKVRSSSDISMKLGNKEGRSPFSVNRHSLRLLEQIAVAVSARESLLLVGETGIGKTTMVQRLGEMLGVEIEAINLSQQSEVGDLLGGFKPVSVRRLAVPLKGEFDALFAARFSSKKNFEFISRLSSLIAKGKWKQVVSLWRRALETIPRPSTSDQTTTIHISDSNTQSAAKRRKVSTDLSLAERTQWVEFSRKVDTFESYISKSSGSMLFAFAEGKLVQAVRNGSWVLLDEINLASPDVLEHISELLETGPNFLPSLLVSEAGAVERVEAHPNFRLFAAMNPATDVGKRSLPMSIRSRFSEIYVESPDKDRQSLEQIVETYLNLTSRSSAERRLSSNIASLFVEIQEAVASNGLVDGSGQRPHFSVRTLTRALSHAAQISSLTSLNRAIYEGCCMCFLTQLDSKSQTWLQRKLQTRLFKDLSIASAELRRPIRMPSQGSEYVQIELKVHSLEKTGMTSTQHCWMKAGREPLQDPEDYIITPYICNNLLNLIRAASTRRFPVLVQGPTSAGKTSMVEYLAKRSGNTFVRINNHEHTDLQEYLGSYVSNSNGVIEFHEGILVQALRQGHWIVLDELNLAPTDVLEALNRLLDDNRELLIPETQEVVFPHENFMLFATQNPAGPYGGRKFLSRAFRNRFLELHFDDIPITELSVILSRRSRLPESWSALIVEVYKRLSQLRQQSRVFEQQSFATLRDLFRWAFRGAETVQQLASQGFMLLAEKARDPEERTAVRSIIEQTMSGKGVRISIDEKQLYSEANCPEMQRLISISKGSISWTASMKRLFCLVAHAARHNEAVLLVGGTGCGKTTVCQMLAEANEKELLSVNAHENLETGDLIGSSRPIRNRTGIELQLVHHLSEALQLTQPSDARKSPVHPSELFAIFDNLEDAQAANIPIETRDSIAQLRGRLQKHFEWQDGSVVRAMKEGQHFLLDEISLAEDSVLERLNSLLDPQRSVLLAEKSDGDSLVVARTGFQFFATMNPGGDYGKKELSPALRNRFTEIWVPQVSDEEELLQIVSARLNESFREYAGLMIHFADWFVKRYRSLGNQSILLRDVLTWADIMNIGTDVPDDAAANFISGAAVVFIDTLGANPSALANIVESNLQQERLLCLEELSRALGQNCVDIYHKATDSLLLSNHQYLETDDFSFHAPTTRINTARILRSLQLKKPILLEGAPGVGKTSTIVAVARSMGRKLARINLSEQTDLMDLFGSDAPVEDADVATFEWRDAPFLTAMKEGGWVLLDEMNLASQSILEGLNAVLDHRAEVFLPELNRTFPRHPEFRLFAAQNPHHQGGGRKGLPSSFVNRFTVVYAEAFKEDDLQLVIRHMFQTLSEPTLRCAVECVRLFDKEASFGRRLGSNGGPWEFNLRDLIRFAQLMTTESGTLRAGSGSEFAEMLFSGRFREFQDGQKAASLIRAVFGEDDKPKDLSVHMSPRYIQVGLAGMMRSSDINWSNISFKPFKLRRNLPLFETLTICVSQKWPVLLTGAPGAGKSFLISRLAALAGARLETLSLNSDTDATDLIGGYEQFDHARQRNQFIDEADADLRKSITHLYTETQGNASSAVSTLLRILERLRSPEIDHSSLSGILDELLAAERQYDLPGLETIRSACDRLLSSSKQSSGPRFQWFDGALVRSIQAGHWVILDNANLCSPSVLDRLNSLLEPDGALLINEQNSLDGTERIIYPHPDFRLFLTYDPQHGEISRAMRNRAVELFVPAWDHMLSAGTSITQESRAFGFHNFKELVTHNNSTMAPDSMLNALLSRLPIKDNHRLPHFIKQASLGLLGQFAEIPQSSMIQNVSSALFRFPILQRLTLDMYRGSFPFGGNHDSVTLSMACHPLENPCLIVHDTATTTRALRLGAIQDAIIHVFQTIADFQRSLKAEPADRRARQLNGDRGMAEWNGANNTLIQDFAIKSLEHILSWVQTALQHSESFLQEAASCAIAIHKMIAWFRAVSKQDHATAGSGLLLQAYFEVLDRFINKNPEIAIFRHVKKLAGPFRRFSSRTTGLSIDRLWPVFRCKTRADSDQGPLQHLEDLLGHLDEKIWGLDVDIKAKAALKQSVMDLFILADSQGIESAMLTQQIRVEVGRIDSRPQASTTPSPRPHFAEVFEMVYLARSSLLSSSSHPSSDSLLQLLADRVSRKDAAFNADGNALSILKDISAHDGAFSRCIPDISRVHDSIFATVLQRLATMKDVPIMYHEQLCGELSSLGPLLAQHGWSLARDPLEYAKKHVANLWACVWDAHRDLIRSEAFDKLHILAESFDNAEHDFTNGQVTEVDINDAFLEPGGSSSTQRVLQSNFDPTLLLRLTSAHAGRSELAHALTSVAIGCIRLYVPDQSYDPSLKVLAEQQLFAYQSTAISDLIASLQWVEHMYSERSETFRTINLSETLSSLEKPPTAKSLTRPQSAATANMFIAFREVLRIAERASMALSEPTASHDELSRLIADVSDVNNTLFESFVEYKDLTRPVNGFLHCLRLGLRLKLQLEDSTNGTSSEYRLFCKVTPFVAKEASFFSIPHECGSDNSTPSRALQEHILEVLSFRAAISPPHAWDEGSQDILSQHLDFFYRYWKSRLLRDASEEANKGRFYEYRGNGDDDDEQQIELEVQKLFPVASSDKTSSDEEKHDEHETPSRLAHKIGSLHVGLFRCSTTPNKQLRNLINVTTHKLGSFPLSADSGNSDGQNPMPHPALLLALQDHSKMLSGSETGDIGYDIYTDPNISEMKKMQTLLREIQNVFRPIAEAWPDHATPKNILSLCWSILSLSISEPVLRYLPEVERLYASLCEWQSVASRDYSAQDTPQKLANLIVSWRRLELSTWNTLLEVEQRNIQSSAFTWWFMLYESIVHNAFEPLGSSTEESRTAELLGTLQAFMEASSIGQFSCRLNMLHAFQHHLELLGDVQPHLQIRSHGLANLTTFYEPFEKQIQGAITSSRNTFEKEVKDTILLASWRDSNVDALKQSSRQSHQKLARIIRKFRKALSQSVAPTLSQTREILDSDLRALDSKSSSLIMPISTSDTRLPSEQLNKNSLLQNSRPPRYQHIETTISRITAACDLSGTADEASSILNLTTDLMENVQQLRRATPSALTEENTSLVKHLTSRKRKLLSDLLKDVKQMGFTSSVKHNISSAQNSREKLLTLLGFDIDRRTSPLVSAGHSRLLQIVSLIDRIRVLPKDRSNDLTQEEIDRCSAYIENMLSASLKHRRTIIECAENLSKLDRRINTMVSLRQSGRNNISSSRDDVGSSLRKLHEMLTTLDPIMTIGAEIVDTQGRMTGNDYSPVLNGLQECSSRLKIIATDMDILGPQPKELNILSTEALRNSAVEALQGLRNALQSWSRAWPELSGVLEHILSWGNWQSLHVPALEESLTPHSLETKDFDEALYDSLDIILASSQQISKCRNSFPASDEESAWFVRATHTREDRLRRYRVDVFLSACAGLLAKLQEVSKDKDDSIEAATLNITSVLPVIMQYRNSYYQELDGMERSHLALTHFLCTTTKMLHEIIVHGFCQPTEPNGQNDKQDKQNLEGGTGLGAGLGADDISKDIASDEDLNELAEGQEGEDDRSVIEGNKDAVELQSDELLKDGKAMEDNDEPNDDTKNEAEDPDIADDKGGNPGDDTADDAGAGENDREDIEDGVGEINDLDHDELDERFWDAPSDDATKTQNSEQTAQKVSKDQQAAMEEAGKPEDEKTKPDEDMTDITEDDSHSIDGSQEGTEEDMNGVNDETQTMDPHANDLDALDLPEDLRFDKDSHGDDESVLEEDEDFQDFEEVEEHENNERLDRLSDHDEDSEGMDETHAEQNNQQTEEDRNLSPDRGEAHESPAGMDIQMTDASQQIEPTEGNAAGQEQVGAEPKTTDTPVMNHENQPQQIDALDVEEQNENHQDSSANGATRQSGHRPGPESSVENVERTRQEPNNESHDTQDAQTVKNIGNILEKWYRQHKSIRPAQSEPEESGNRRDQDFDPSNVEFEHTAHESMETDAQALGAATHEEARPIEQGSNLEQVGSMPNPQDHNNFDESAEDDQASTDNNERARDSSVPHGNVDDEDMLYQGAMVGEPTSFSLPTHTKADPSEMDLPSELEDVRDDQSQPTSESPSSVVQESDGDPAAVWAKHEVATHASAMALTERLRLTLAPTLATKLRGDFRTGKRLNIKRIIPYIASKYKRDKIWMRRSLPSKRAYQILLAIDDSKSMTENGSDELAFDTLALVARSLSMLEAGEIGVVGFGEEVSLAHELGAQWNSQAGAEVVSKLRFNQSITNVRKLIKDATYIFRDARLKSRSGSDLWQLGLIISDGICEDHEGIRRLLLEAQEERIMFVFIVVDALKSNGNAKSQSIHDLEKVEFIQDSTDKEGVEGAIRVERRKYLDTFPFRFYLVVKDVQQLPGVLAMALQQWFAEVAFQ